MSTTVYIIYIDYIHHNIVQSLLLLYFSRHIFSSHLLLSIRNLSFKFGREEIGVRLFSSKRTSFRQPRLSTRRLAQDLTAARADDYGLSMRKDSRDGEAAWTLDVHEERSRSWDERLIIKTSAINVQQITK